MTEDKEPNLEKIYEEYLAAKKKADEAWEQFEICRANMFACNAVVEQFEQYKKPFMVRVYKEVYYDFEVDGFNGEDAVEKAKEVAEVKDWETFQYFAASEPRFKALCPKEEYTEEMEDKDE